ncbi:hypothetical protein [Curtobacterium sp. VKM Ac-1395]|uniref:hypothetical protein n=1 Tax=Curtobacterium sp. VKM Ac-1395 TaxID=2783815 RepID=UPI00188B6E8D|nr:hypothetical protein [Curtobacterium sp. VKM Ac-1395]MBF4591084.1 hypothetical protein [Curtobacterium sp. VKM Ac-1395]
MDRIRRLPLPALLPIMFVVVGGLYFLIGLLTSPEETMPGRLVGTLVYAVIFSAGFSILIAVRRRKAGGAEAVTAMQRTIRTGKVPADADSATWIPELERYRVRYRRNRWVVPVMFVLFAALCVSLALSAGPVWWLFLVLFAGLCVYSGWETRRALRNLDASLEELRRRPITSAPAGSAPGTPQPTAGAAWTLPGDEAPRPDDAS